jgi:hypothetical protein
MGMKLYEEALDRQVRFAQLFQGQHGPAFAEMLHHRHQAVALNTWEDVAYRMAEGIMTAPTYAITKDMLAVVGHGADEMSKNMPTFYHDSMLPNDTGFIWFEHPIPFKLYVGDLADDGEQMWHHNVRDVAGMWWQTVPTVGIYANAEKLRSGEPILVDPDDPDLELMPGVTMGLIMHRDVATTKPEIRAKLPLYVPIDMTAWADGIPWREVNEEYWIEHAGVEMGIVTEAGSYWRRWMLSFWALCSQHIEYRPAPRAARRRQERAGPSPSPDYGDIRVILLRRRTIHPEDHQPQHVDVAWSHRWMVSGHWRWQAVGKGRAQHRWTYINPYVKGPDDKPLILTDKVHILGR